MIVYAHDDKPVKWPKEDSHDPDNESYYYISYKPEVRVDSTAYVKGVDVMIPPTDNGCMYVCISGGTSASTIPNIPTIEGGVFYDGDVTWKCKPFTTRLGSADSISSSVWTGDVGVTLTLDAIVGGTTEVKVTAVPSGVTSFTITNEIGILLASGKTEKRQKTIIIPVKEL